MIPPVLRNWPLVALFVLLAGGAAAQDELPTLKLDRLPAQPAFAGQTRAPAAKPSTFAVEIVTETLSAPWAIAELPDGRLLVNEYTGAMRIVSLDGEVSAPVGGLPDMSHEGWAGLFDVALDPDFAANHRIYFSYTVANGVDDEGKPANKPQVATAVLDADALRLTEVRTLVDGFGGQELHLSEDGYLFVAGAGNVFADDAQDRSITFGKLLRLHRDGSVPADNPWAGHAAWRPEVFSYGHRDISGIATHPVTGDIWITEHGARGGDELNVVRPGANYGWKIISYGTEYDGTPIGEGATSHPAMEQPRYFWRPSIAPSGLMFYTGDMFPEWRDSVFVTALAGEHIARLVMDGDRVVAEERLLADRGERIRELKQAADGSLLVLTNEASDAPKGGARLLRIYRR